MPLLSPHLFLHRPKKLFVSLTPAGKSAFLRAAKRQATKKKQALISPYHFCLHTEIPKDRLGALGILNVNEVYCAA